MRNLLNRIGLLLLIVTLGIIAPTPLQAKPKPKKPRLVAIFVLDQFAYHYLKKLRPHFHYGLKDLLDKGIFYANAYYPHAIPETTTGHHCLSTGALPKDHGAILNDWINAQYAVEPYDQDDNPETAVLRDDNTTMPGKSPHKTMTDGLSDQFICSATPGKKQYEFSLALKSYPAIATATRRGKAIWFDDVYGGFTSSKAYFKELPAWVRAFNEKHKFSSMESFDWKLCYPATSRAYKFSDIKNYDFAGYPFSMVEKGTITLDKTNCKTPYKIFLQSPASGHKLMRLAQECLIEHTKHDDTTIFMWILLSNLDLVCHFYGPQSLEAIDTIYHLDYELSLFMKTAAHRVGLKNCLFVMTADHGIGSIPELAAKNGQTLAKRILADPLIEQANEHIMKLHGFSNVIKGYEPTSFTLNKELLASLDGKKQKAVIHDLKTFLERQEGIRHVWTQQELKDAPYTPGQREYCYKTQIYPGRIGDLICMPQPYCQITHYPTGTSHMSPYEYDTHVPLVIYQPGQHERKVITDKVSMTQVAPTVAHIMGINRPATAMEPILPGI